MEEWVELVLLSWQCSGNSKVPELYFPEFRIQVLTKHLLVLTLALIDNRNRNNPQAPPQTILPHRVTSYISAEKVGS